jgi:hypothetical protein
MSAYHDRPLDVHPLAERLPAMLRDEYCELVVDIKRNKLQQPIVLYEGKILDGRHRYMACRELDIMPTTVDFTGTKNEAEAYVLSLNVHRRHLSLEQKHKIVAAELKRDPAQSDRSIASKAKVSPTTVGKARAKAEELGVVSRVDTVVGVDGVKQPTTKKSKIATISMTADPVNDVAPAAPPAVLAAHSTPNPLTITATWLRKAGPRGIAEAIADALASEDLARRVARELARTWGRRRREAFRAEARGTCQHAEAPGDAARRAVDAGEVPSHVR